MLNSQHLDVGFSASRCCILLHVAFCYMLHFAASELQVKRWIYRNLICPFGRICLFPLVGIVCGFSANLFVAFPQSCLWVCRRFICGFPTDLFVGLPQICLWVCRKLVCVFPAHLFAAFPHTGIID